MVGERSRSDCCGFEWQLGRVLFQLGSLDLVPAACAGASCRGKVLGFVRRDSSLVNDKHTAWFLLLLMLTALAQISSTL